MKLQRLLTILPLLVLLLGFSCSSRTAQQQSISTEHLRVDNLVSGQIVSSPLTLTGSARVWYFEASFPVEVRDAAGRQLAITPAQAQSDWMTEDWVPFSVTLTFDRPSTGTGTLIFMKDNPSGLPEFDERVEVPVRFE